jgi:hypothetical protein
LYAALQNAGHRSVPQKLDSAIPGSFYQHFMKSRAPNSNSLAFRERSGNLPVTLHEANSAKRISAQIVCRDAQIPQGR